MHDANNIKKKVKTVNMNVKINVLRLFMVSCSLHAFAIFKYG